MNDIGEIRLRTSKPLIFDAYATNRLTGSFILIEQGTNATVGAGMPLSAHRGRQAGVQGFRDIKFFLEIS